MRIHHTCKILNRDFTYPEWIWFINDPARERDKSIIYTEDGFNWNINDVCINPNEKVIYNKEDDFIVIYTAKFKDKWGAALGYQSILQASSSPVNFTDCLHYTENDAIEDCVTKSLSNSRFLIIQKQLTRFYNTLQPTLF